MFQGFSLGIKGLPGRRRDCNVSSLGENQTEPLQGIPSPQYGFALTLPILPANLGSPFGVIDLPKVFIGTHPSSRSEPVVNRITLMLHLAWEKDHRDEPNCFSASR